MTKTLDYKRTERAARVATAFMILGFFLLLSGVIARGISNGHVPWGNMYEFSITGALSFTGVYLMALRKYDLRWLGLFISLGVLLTLGTAITLLYRDSAPLVPALKSTWLVIHVVAAIISGGVFLLANVIAGAYLYLDNVESKGGRPAWLRRLPALDVLDQLSYRLVAFVFPLWTFSVIAGAIFRSEILIKVVEPSPETKLSSDVELPPPPHAVNTNASTINVATFFITSSLAISVEQALNT
jgi:ABC-type transport system involved in cytochrome c biogenesis permease subunit